MAMSQAFVTLRAEGPHESFAERKFTLTPDSPSIPVGRSSKRENIRGREETRNAFFSSPVISRLHAKIFIGREDRVLWIEDVGSMHGTSVNGKKLESGKPHKLRSGDIVSIGSDVVQGQKEYLARTFRITFDWELAPDVRTKPSSSDKSKPKTALREPSVMEIPNPYPAAEMDSSPRLAKSFAVPDSSSEGSDYGESVVDDFDVGFMHLVGEGKQAKATKKELRQLDLRAASLSSDDSVASVVAHAGSSKTNPVTIVDEMDEVVVERAIVLASQHSKNVKSQKFQNKEDLVYVHWDSDSGGDDQDAPVFTPGSDEKDSPDSSPIVSATKTKDPTSPNDVFYSCPADLPPSPHINTGTSSKAVWLRRSTSPDLGWNGGHKVDEELLATDAPDSHSSSTRIGDYLFDPSPTFPKRPSRFDKMPDEAGSANKDGPTGSRKPSRFDQLPDSLPPAISPNKMFAPLPGFFSRYSPPRASTQPKVRSNFGATMASYGATLDQDGSSSGPSAFVPGDWFNQEKRSDRPGDADTRHDSKSEYHPYYPKNGISADKPSTVPQIKEVPGFCVANKFLSPPANENLVPVTAKTQLEPLFGQESRKPISIAWPRGKKRAAEEDDVPTDEFNTTSAGSKEAAETPAAAALSAIETAGEEPGQIIDESLAAVTATKPAAPPREPRRKKRRLEEPPSTSSAAGMGKTLLASAAHLVLGGALAVGGLMLAPDSWF